MIRVQSMREAGGKARPFWTDGPGGTGYSAFALEPLIWFDATDPATLFSERTGASASTPANVGGRVGTWKSKGSGSPIYAVVSYDGSRPTRQSVYVDFPTTKWLRATLSSSIPQPYTIFSLSRPISPGPGHWYDAFSAGTHLEEVRILRYGGGGGNLKLPDFYAGADLFCTAHGQMALGEDYLCCAIGNGYSSFFRVNNQEASGNAGTRSLSTQIGIGIDQLDRRAQAGRVYQIMIFDSALTADQIAATEIFLASKKLGLLD
jgi:hypothetical protein